MRILLIGVLLLFPTLSAKAQNHDSSSMQIDIQREKEIKEYSSVEFPKIRDILNNGNSLLSLSILNQSVSDLKTLAKKANQAGNIILMIQKEYSSYYRNNYKYDFIQKKISGPHDSYLARANKFLDLRNQAYFNLGLKMLSRNDKLQAFFYFRDAYRLSNFDCGPGNSAKTCMRWKAEQEMQKLLEISDINAYVSWK